MTDRLDRYAAVLLDVGLQFQPGQDLAVNGQIEHAPFARALAEQAYQRGAHYVDIWYWDPHAKRSRVRHAPEETLSRTPSWLDQRYRDLADRKGALVNLVGDPEPDLLAGLDGHRVGLDRMPALASRFHVQSRALVAWTFGCYPSPAWATSLFGAPDVDRLWAYLEHFLRLDEPDPVAAWNDHLDRLRANALRLSAEQFDAIRFTGPGTDLTLGLIPGATWEISELTGPTGRPNVLNLPTEEIYTTPDYRRVDGHVSSTRPLALGGTLVRDLRLTVSGGRITTVEASHGAEVVRAQQATDAGATMFGEIALVDNSSRIGQSGITFRETLLDENATCHLAWGDGIPSVVPGWSGLEDEELRCQGVNQSAVHTDFMVGGPGITVTGIRADNSEQVIIEDEQWQLQAT